MLEEEIMGNSDIRYNRKFLIQVFKNWVLLQIVILHILSQIEGEQFLVRENERLQVPGDKDIFYQPCQ